MKRKLFGENVTPACEYCCFGRFGADRTKIYCLKCGVCDLRDSCKKFSYDPMKRRPKELPQKQEFSESDFEI